MSRNGGNVSIFVVSLMILWFLAALSLAVQVKRIWRLNFGVVGAMTIAQVYHASRRGLIVVFVSLTTLSWPLWLEVNLHERAVFRDGKLVRVIESRTVMFQQTWYKTTAEADVVLLSRGVIGAGTVVEMPCPGNDATNGVLIIKIDGRNHRDDIAKRLEYCLKSGVSEGYSPSIVKRVVSESSQWDSLCRMAKKLPIEEKGDGTTRLKAKREVLEIAEKISVDLWSRFGIRIIDVDYR